MKTSRISRVIVAAAVSAACVFGLTACSSDDKDEGLTSSTGLTGGVAAKVNDTEIEEDSVTRAINNMRLSYGFEEDDAWKEYLKSAGYTVESMRYSMLGSLIDRELTLQCAEQRGVTVSDEEIQSYVDKMSSQYSSEEAWQQAVKDAGWQDLDSYKDALRYSITSEKLEEGFKAEQEELMDDTALLTAVNDNKTTYDGIKKSSHILFSTDNEAQANEVLAQIQSGALSFEDAVQQYSTDEESKANGGDVGWDKFAALDSAYTEALTGLEEGATSEVVKGDDGFHIIMCTDVWTAPEGDVTSTSSVPSDLLAEIRTAAVETNTNTAYNDWLVSKHPENTITVNKMPDGVPYWVDMSDVYSEEEAQKINDKAEQKLITGVEAEEEEATAEEAAGEAADAEAESGDTAAEDAGQAAEDAVQPEATTESTPEEAQQEN